MTRERLLAEMPSSEFQRWALLEQIEPFGSYAGALNHASLMSLLCNVYRKEGTPAYSQDDFMPITFQRKKSTEPAMSPKKIHALMMMMKAHQDAYLARMRKLKAG